MSLFGDHTAEQVMFEHAKSVQYEFGLTDSQTLSVLLNACKSFTDGDMGTDCFGYVVDDCGKRLEKKR